MTGLLFSIVICTHNRAAYLDKALAGIELLDFDPDRFEILVVDNGSTDDTKVCAARHIGGRKAIRYVFEGQLGLSVARNTGWREAKGRYIAYLDDDAIPCSRWLKVAEEVFDAHGDEIGMLGGKVEPIWEAPRPDWLTDNLVGYLSMVDLGESPRFVDEDNGIVGANMFIPRALLERFGGFAPATGRVGETLLSNEELVLKRNLAREGYRGFYHPEVCVRHHASAERLTRAWFRKRLYWQGRSNAIMLQIEEPKAWPRRATRAAVELAKAGMLYLGSNVDRRRFDWRVRANGHFGLAEGLVRE